MTGVRIVDRRHDSKNKSSVNRSRFMRRFKGQIRKAVAEAIGRRAITDIDDGEKISIPARDIAEPQFHYRRGGVWQDVLPGNDRFRAGDESDRPVGGAGQAGSKGSSEGEGSDDFVFTLTREEFLDVFFDDLELPDLVKTQLARVQDFRKVRAGYTSTGVPTNINIVRSLRGATGRRIAMGGPLRRKIAELEARLETLAAAGDGSTPEAEALRQRIECLRRRLERLPFIDDFDLRYNNRIRIPLPTTQAVMFCLMDVSASMDERKKQIAKRFFMLLYLFLTRSYDRIEVVFIRHHTEAEEVDEERFFRAQDTGGTVVSSALRLMSMIITERYATGVWNIYGAQASDGEDSDGDTPLCREILAQEIVPRSQFFAYIEISNQAGQSLWDEYTKLRAVQPRRLAMQRIGDLPDIYPVFRELFQKRLALK